MLAASGAADHLAADMRGLQALKARAAANDPEALRAAARQFEAMLLHTVMKQMRETSWQTQADAFAPSESLKLYRELLDQLWVQRLVQGKGLGFAEQITAQLRQQLGHTAEATSADKSVQAVAESAPRREVELSAGADAPTIQMPADAGASAAVSHQARFLKAMRPYAEAAAQRSGVPADFILAHAALESGWGRREIKSSDGRPSYNLFGIKAGGNWRGSTVEVLTTEYRHGLPIKLSQRFRAYDGYDQAFADYAELLIRRYQSAVRARGDAQAFAEALATGGYATDPGYAGKLRAVIAHVERMLG